MKVYVIGVGMTPFTKPSPTNPDYPDIAHTAIQRALRDAGVPYTAIQQAFVGYVYGDSAFGQRAIYQSGMTSIPVIFFCT